MKTIKGTALILILCLFLGSLVACSPTDPISPVPSPSQSEKERADKEKSKIQFLALPGTFSGELPRYSDLPETLPRSLWAFAGKTSGPALKGQEGENRLYSPVSLYYALAMLEAGAQGKTKADLLSFMEARDLDLGADLQKLYALMTLDQEGSMEDVANSIWIRKDLLEGGKAVKQAWLDQLSQDLFASSFAVDFNAPETGEAMSDWVARATHGKIKPDIQLDDPMLFMVLMNTLYYQAEWAEKFDPNPQEKEFYLEGGTVIQASYLARTFKQHPAIKTDHYLSVPVALKNGLIRLVLPAPGMSPESLLEDPHFLPALLEDERARFYDVDLELPIFQYQSRLNLLESLEPLGLASMVTEGADFSAMFDGEIWVSGINQESYISLNEKGIEAAAYTEIAMAGAMPPQDVEKIRIQLNRPFLFVISDRAGVPLFVGSIHHPQKEG